LIVLKARDLPSGWAGKLWALSEGHRYLKQAGISCDYLWLSDADIDHSPETLGRLVAKAVCDKRELTSLMVLLRTGGFWGKLLIPPFVYFFQKLYPFNWSADPGKRTAAAAGGCVLLKREAFESAGGFEAIHGALIDDCSLARLIKRRGGGSGRIWLGLTKSSVSLRPYRGLEDIWNMVARSAYTQLHSSSLLLVAALFGLGVTYLLPPGLLVLGLTLGDGPLAGGALLVWLTMALTMLPVLKLYDQSPIWGPLLPFAALLYGAMTISSALRHWRGKGGAWKGRHRA
ncbi:MAG: glycosyltransferase, partial [Kiloniellales bacterium]|nr:glycosyltransferase [Kiloniellales bacterium]